LSFEVINVSGLESLAEKKLPDEEKATVIFFTLRIKENLSLTCAASLTLEARPYTVA
jgi:hypothetical protein